MEMWCLHQLTHGISGDEREPNNNARAMYNTFGLEYISMKQIRICRGKNEI